MGGRKFTGTLIAFGLLLIGYIITHYLDIDSQLFKIFGGFVIAINFGYNGTNIINKKITNGGK